MAFCGKCGSQLRENATFCANCGTPVGAPAAPSQPVAGTPATPPAYVPQRIYAAAPAAPHDSFGAMFDFTFKNSAGMPLVKVLFAITLLLLVVVAVLVIIAAQNQTTIDPIVAIIVVPIVAFLYIMQTRLIMEVCAAVLRMEKHLIEMLQQGRR